MQGRLHKLLGVLVVAAPLALHVAPATATVSLGTISGQVTDASTHAPLKGIEVCAIAQNTEFDGEEEGEEKEEEEHAFGCAMTGGHGEYTISSLTADEIYSVLFTAPPTTKLNYIGEYYDGKVPPAEPTEVEVNAGQTSSGVDAQLQPGAQLSGKVTAVGTGSALEEVLVAAVTGGPAAEEVVSYTYTGENGSYTLSGLPTGSFTVVFYTPRYLVQYYDGKAAYSEANAVSVIAPQLTRGIDAALQPGSSAPPPLIFRPTASTPPGAAAGHLAGKPGGTFPSPQLAGATGKVSLLSRRIVVRRPGVALVRLGCSGTGTHCRAKLALRIERTESIEGKRRRRELSIGTGSLVSLASGQKATVKIKLSRSALSSLDAGHGPLSAQLVLTTGAGKQRLAVLLSAQKPGGRKTSAHGT